ncbi:transporter substrate-binding domain-containing protein [Nakamurella endophytica]|uniref:Uncharacterized protein n=1 Tax=Nakamurella endophytica TaxID=1748367 RepID=A0A917T2C8_9ACTN|nr:transporter substrate-binding domain-containing protein [Nakamurella endophytica]GGM06814.1 hypothetical protein GCM10011594_28550 [Nakamurella endophytica]
MHRRRRPGRLLGSALAACSVAALLAGCATPAATQTAGAAAGSVTPAAVVATGSGSAPASDPDPTRPVTPASAGTTARTTAPGTASTTAPTTALGSPTGSATVAAPTTGAGATSAPLPGCVLGELPTAVPGRLTFGTGRAPARPWFAGAPAAGQGFEAALAYAVAARLGYPAAAVSWVTVDPAAAQAGRTRGVDAVLGEFVAPDVPGAADRWSTGYFPVTDTVVTAPGTRMARSLAALRSVRVGATAAGTAATSAASATGRAPVRYGSAAAALAALRSGAVRAAVLDSPTALREAAAGRVAVLGQLPAGPWQPPQLAMAVPGAAGVRACVSAAIDTLRAERRLDALAARWLPAAALTPLR